MFLCAVAWISIVFLLTLNYLLLYAHATGDVTILQEVFILTLIVIDNIAMDTLAQDFL